MKAIELFKINIQRTQELLDMHRQKYPRGRPASEGPQADLLRAVIVFEVAALDAYIHKRTIESVKTIMHYKKRVPESCVNIVETKFKEKDGYRELLNISLQKDPETRVVHLVEEALQAKSYQKPKIIETAFKMAEIKEPWKKINKILRFNRGPRGNRHRPGAQKILSDLADRRDEIVHRNDMFISKKHHGKIRPISRRQVNESFGALRKIVFAIEKVSEKYISL
jgi:hypothetical protein